MLTMSTHQKSMVTPKITAHCLVKNEQNWVWYSIMSVIDYVDEIMVWDTGSSDETLKVVKSINSSKLRVRQTFTNDPKAITCLRQKMIEETKEGWVMILDGDEIWTDGAIRESWKLMESKKKLRYLVNRYINFVGDVYHFQDPKAEKYEIAGFKGNINLRLVNLDAYEKVSFEGDLSNEWMADENGTKLQDETTKVALVSDPYLHATRLSRSGNMVGDKTTFMRKLKYKCELGTAFPKSFTYPKVFYLPRPVNVPSPWQRRSYAFVVNAIWQSPIKWLIRRLTSGA